jgi:fibronectin-binding autotransporter adhesin
MKTSHFSLLLAVFSLTAAALFTFGAVSPSANAATATWDAGGGANDNWDYQSVPGTYDNWVGNLLPAAADDVIFQNVAPTGNSISLNGDRTVNSLTLNQTITQNFSIDNNILTVTSGSITRNAGSLGDNNIASTILLGTNGVILNNSGNGRLLVRVVDDGASTFDVSYRGIGGSLVSTVMEGASTYGGDSFIAGTNLTLNAATRIASIVNSPSITAVSGGLILGAGAGTAAPDNGTTTFGRIGNSAPVTLYGGRLTMLGSNNQTGDNATERFGTLGFATGLSTLRVTRGTGTADATLFASAFSRDGTTNGTRGTVFIDQNSTTQQLGLSEFIKGVNYTGLATVGGGGSRATDDSIVPYMSVDNAFSTQSRADSFIRVDPTNGLVPLALADYATDINAVSGDGNDNVRLSGSAATFTMNASTTINALVLDNLSSVSSATELTGSAGTILTVKSGAILGAATGAASAGNKLSVPTLAFGSVEGVLTNVSTSGSGFQVTSSITGNNGLTFNGGINLQLTGNNSGLSGPVTVNSGKLSPGVNGLNINTPLRTRAGATVVAPSASGGVTLTVPSVSGAGTLEVSSSGNAMYISGTAATGLAGFTLLAGGSISPGDAPQFPGTTLNTGTLTFRNSTSGTGVSSSLAVRLNGGTLNIDLASLDYFDSLALTTLQATPAVTLTLDGSTTLALTLGFAPVLGDFFKIVDVAGTTASTGSFSNLNSVTTTYESNLYDFSILYNSSLGGGTGNDIVLRLDNIVVVPEPATWALLASSLAAVMVFRRRMRS